MNILLTAANSAKAQKLKNQLEGQHVILGDNRELPSFMLKSGDLIQLPDPASIAYTREMLTLCLDNQIEIIYALRDPEYLLLKQAEQLFAEYGVEIVDKS